MRTARAKGTPNPDGKSKSIAVHFENEIFDRIATEAAERGRSFGEQLLIYVVRRLWGKVRRTQRLPTERAAYWIGVDGTVHVTYGGKPEPISTAIAAKPEHPTWAAYDALMAGHQSYPGWTFCKFGVRGPREQDHSEVAGIVRAPFGIWWAPFLCISPTGLQATHGLACVAHTRSGMAIGVFGHMDMAVQAAEIAARMADWDGFSFDEGASMQLIQRLRTAWAAAGIIHSPISGYPIVNDKVQEGQPPIAIYVKNVMDHEQRPEKLS